MENFNTKDILPILMKNKTRIIIVTIIAAVVSVFISYMLKPKFKSYAVVFPVNLSPSSEESNTEQLLQYFYSEEVKHAVAKKFDLYTHYEVDTTAKGHEAMFDLYFKGNVNISPTLYESIEIVVKDESPTMARDIAQAMIDETNDLILKIKRERLAEYIANVSKAVSSEVKNIDSINYQINELRKRYDIIDVSAQARYLSKKLYSDKQLTEANKITYEGLKTKNVELSKLFSVYSGQAGTLNYFLDQKDKYLFDYNSKISFTNVVSKPTLPDKKFFPVRWLIVTISTLSVFALASLFFILSNKSVRKVD
jgi:uncharacterized protein involved in exopolysaccharide biosynthesis